MRPNAYETSALPLSYAGRFVAGAGIEPASGDYEPPEVTVPPPRVVIIFTIINKSTIIISCQISLNKKNGGEIFLMKNI